MYNLFVFDAVNDLTIAQSFNNIEIAVHARDDINRDFSTHGCRAYAIEEPVLELLVKISTAWQEHEISRSNRD